MEENGIQELEAMSRESTNHQSQNSAKHATNDGGHQSQRIQRAKAFSSSCLVFYVFLGMLSLRCLIWGLLDPECALFSFEGTSPPSVCKAVETIKRSRIEWVHINSK